MADICDDNRFEIIDNAKKHLIEATNIESRPDEMAVIDSVLFRMWQMGWLPGRTCKQVLVKCSDGLMPTFTAHCSECLDEWGYTPNYCPNCGAKVVW